jgi:hypothetical protein
MSAIDPLAAILGTLDRPVQPRPEFAQTLLSRLVEELGDGAQTPTRKPRQARLRLPQGRSAEHATRSPRRVLVLVALLVLAFVLMAAVAYALGHPLIDFSSAPHAKEPVVREFSSLFSVGAPPGMDPQVTAGETRLVGKIEGHTLWIAPTKHGGLCYVWSKASGGCDALGTVPLGVTWAGGSTGPSSQPSLVSVEGFAHARWVDEVEIELGDHSTVRPQLVWISPPIDAGFYYYRAPQGRAIEAVAALKEGEVVARESAPGGAAPGPHPFADLSKRDRVAEIETDEGTAILWTAPTKTEGRCAWLEFGDEELAVTPCLPKGYEHQVGAAYAVHRLGGVSILAGECGYSGVQFIHRDRSVRTVPCSDGLVFQKLESADTAGEMGFLDANGHLLPRSRHPVRQALSVIASIPAGSTGSTARARRP